MRHKLNIDDYIVVLKNLVPKDFCQEIIEEYKNCPHFLKAEVGSGLDTSTRNCDNLNISLGGIISENLEKRQKIDQVLFGYVSNAITEYKTRFPDISIEEDTGYILLRYNKGQFYKQHTDSFKKEPRMATISIALNDDFEGGEFAFFDRKIIKTFETGDALMFPSNFMYPHEVMEVKEGTRYSIVSWFR